MSSWPGQSSTCAPQRSCGHPLEANHDLGGGPRKRLARSDQDRDPRPAPVLDLEAESNERLGVRVGPHAVDVPIADVLAADHRGRIRCRHRSEHIGPAAWDRVGVSGRRLHGDEREHLQEMVLYDVPERANRVVERTAILDTEVLGHRDLDGLDVLSVPERLEESVREPEVHDVLDRLLPEEVVDAEQALLGDDGGQAPVQLPRRRKVGAEGLLDDQPRPLSDEAFGRELFGDLPEHRRRRREVEDRCLGISERDAQAVVQRLFLRIAADVTHSRQELLEHLLVEILLPGGDGLRHVAQEFVPGQCSATDADDLAHEQTLLGEVVESGKRAAVRQIAGDPEDDERVCVLAAHDARSDCAAERSISTPSSRSSTLIRSFAEWTSFVASSVSMALSGKYP